jgi:hypothetical protein
LIRRISKARAALLLPARWLPVIFSPTQPGPYHGGIAQVPIVPFNGDVLRIRCHNRPLIGVIAVETDAAAGFEFEGFFGSISHHIFVRVCFKITYYLSAAIRSNSLRTISEAARSQLISGTFVATGPMKVALVSANVSIAATSTLDATLDPKSTVLLKVF